MMVFMFLFVILFTVLFVKWLGYRASLSRIHSKSRTLDKPIIYYQKGWWTLWLFSEAEDLELKPLDLAQKMLWREEDIKAYELNILSNVEYLLFVYDERGIVPFITFTHPLGDVSCALSDYHKFLLNCIGVKDED